MKKIILFYASENEKEKQKFNYLFYEHNNSLIRFNREKGKFYFHSKFKKPEEIIIEHRILKYNEILIKTLKDFLKESHEIAKEMVLDDEIGKLDNKIFSEIEGFIFKCSQPDNEPKTIFHFVAEFVYKYGAGHKMIDGNKRLTFIFMINILRFFGYHFDWSQGKRKDYQKHKKEFEKLIANSHNLNSKTIEKYIDEVADWIKNKSTIALEWR